MTEICSSNKSSKVITLGYISGVYGVKGMVKVFSYTKPRENILKYKDWQLDKNGETSSILVETGRIQGKGVVAKLEHVDDRDQAAKLINATICVSRDELPELAPGEFYWSDLVGLDVVNVDGKSYGKVDYLFETGANDVLVAKGEKEILIPFIQGEYIKSIDLEAGLIQVDWPEDF